MVRPVILHKSIHLLMCPNGKHDDNRIAITFFRTERWNCYSCNGTWEGLSMKTVLLIHPLSSAETLKIRKNHGFQLLNSLMVADLKELEPFLELQIFAFPLAKLMHTAGDFLSHILQLIDCALGNCLVFQHLKSCDYACILGSVICVVHTERNYDTAALITCILQSLDSALRARTDEFTTLSVHECNEPAVRVVLTYLAKDRFAL